MSMIENSKVRLGIVKNGEGLLTTFLPVEHTAAADALYGWQKIFPHDVLKIERIVLRPYPQNTGWKLAPKQ